MSLKVKGTIKQILQVESGTSKAGKAWQKQGFVIDTGAQYNPEVCFSLFGDEKIGLLRNFQEGQDVEVSFNISSREFNGKWYHNIDAWKLDAIGNQAPTASGNMAPPPAEPPADFMNDGDESDDLPF